MKKWLRFAVTLLLCALLLIYVVDVDLVIDTLSHCNPLWAGFAVLAFFIDRVLMSYKWGLLLAIRGYEVSLAKKLMVYCSSMMWGLALPSTVGADGIRVMLVRRFGVRVDDTIATILVERGIGFISALLTAVVSLIILRWMLPQDVIYDYMLVLGIAGLMVGVGILVFSFTSNALNSLLRLIPRRFADSKVVTLLVRLHEAYASLGTDRPRIAAFSVLTLIEQTLVIVCYGLVAVALGIEFNPMFMLAAVPLAILVSRLPISLDGLGVYEGIFIMIMALGGVQPADALAVSLAARAFQIVVWLPWWLLLAAQSGMRPPSSESMPAAPARSSLESSS